MNAIKKAIKFAKWVYNFDLTRFLERVQDLIGIVFGMDNLMCCNHCDQTCNHKKN